jgi:hypothetical protein
LSQRADPLAELSLQAPESARCARRRANTRSRPDGTDLEALTVTADPDETVPAMLANQPTLAPPRQPDRGLSADVPSAPVPL